MLEPYRNALAYVSEWFHNGTPLEQNWAIRKNSDDFKSLNQYQLEHRPKAYRYNVGEMSNFTNLPMIAMALQQINEWGTAAVQEYAKYLLKNCIPLLQKAGYYIGDENARANHLFGIRLPEGMKLNVLQNELFQRQVYISYRGTAIRVSVHFWNDENDLQKLTKIQLQHQL